jgi:hypothetical protein
MAIGLKGATISSVILVEFAGNWSCRISHAKQRFFFLGKNKLQKEFLPAIIYRNGKF